MVAVDLHEGTGDASHVAGDQCDLGKIRQANASQYQSRLQAARCVNTAIEDAGAGGRVDGYAMLGRVGRQEIGETLGAPFRVGVKTKVSLRD